MKKVVVYLTMLIFLVNFGVCANTCNLNGESSIFSQWKDDWGMYQWGDNPQINQYYIVETNGAFRDMLRACDMVGLKRMLNYLGKNEIINYQKAQGSYLDNILQEDIHPLVVEFLLDNELIFKVLHPTINYKEIATQKLNIAKSKGDSKAIANYGKIIKILK